MILPAASAPAAAEGAVHYYQGLHDVASVLLLVAGELPAFDMLCKVATGHLRDATRPSLDPVIELLGLMGPIVELADPELAQFISKQGLPPFYALSWFITWFSHDLKDFGEVIGCLAIPVAVVLWYGQAAVTWHLYRGERGVAGRICTDRQSTAAVAPIGFLHTCRCARRGRLLRASNRQLHKHRSTARALAAYLYVLMLCRVLFAAGVPTV